MGGRVCLHCGKTLSRIRVGAGEDFCSREHRNQYRFRRSMDHLQEAGKVASLMRRRESPRPLVHPVEAGSGAPEYRAYTEFRCPEVSRIRAPETPASVRAALSNTTRHAGISLQPVVGEADRREYRLLRPSAGKLEIVRRPVRAVPPERLHCENFRLSPPAICQGAVLRVSMSAGFHAPAAPRQAAFRPGPATPTFCPPERGARIVPIQSVGAPPSRRSLHVALPLAEQPAGIPVFRWEAPGAFIRKAGGTLAVRMEPLSGCRAPLSASIRFVVPDGPYGYAYEESSRK